MDFLEWNFTSIKISLKFVPKGQINNIPALVRIMAWRRPGDKPLSETMMVTLLTHICVTRPQWVNQLSGFETEEPSLEIMAIRVQLYDNKMFFNTCITAFIKSVAWLYVFMYAHIYIDTYMHEPICIFLMVADFMSTLWYYLPFIIYITLQVSVCII